MYAFPVLPLSLPASSLLLICLPLPIQWPHHSLQNMQVSGRLVKAQSHSSGGGGEGGGGGGKGGVLAGIIGIVIMIL